MQAGSQDSVGERVTLGVGHGLVVGKTMGSSAPPAARPVTHAELADELSWWDVLGLALLGGVGFTVSLLVGELAFGAGSPRDGPSSKSGCRPGRCLRRLWPRGLRIRNRVYRRMAEEERRDTDRDGIPDVYQHDNPSTTTPSTTTQPPSVRPARSGVRTRNR